MADQTEQGSGYLLDYTARWKFTAVPGVFRDFAPEDLPNGKLPTQPRLALLHQEYPPTAESSEAAAAKTDHDGVDHTQDWPRFAEYVRALNRDAPDGVRYKVLYLTRHGVGYHNQKSVEVGVEAWDTHWALLNGDGVNYWFDSYLAPEGEAQAGALSTFYDELFTQYGVPLPDTVYTSPLSRCLQTTDLAYRGILPAPFRAVIKENLRERWTGHTCDRRRTRTHIGEHWADKGYVFEDGFTEGDPLGWDQHETDADHVRRKQAALDDLWTDDEGQFLLVVCHSFAIRSIQMLLGLTPFRVKEGSSMAMLIKGDKI